ncbi:MAG: hypothetical protein HFI88_12215 [Lachnospiraceae bacterium]|nr:hypothetical protein [Lachnospiraceae bacterium]
MDKAEYQVRLGHIKELVDSQDYEGALKIVQTIEWKRVKSVNTLCMVADIYEANGMLEDCKRILRLAYNRSPIGKTILSRLVELALKLDKPDEAADYYHRFVKAAPSDATRYLLKYKIYKAQEAPIEDLIDALRSYKDREYTERWAYELARLYSKAGMDEECVEECDDIILWFSEGVYVIRAMELKMKYTPLTPSQQEKYNNRYETTPELYEQTAARQASVAEFPQAGAFGQPQAAPEIQSTDTPVPAPRQEESFTSTVDLQERLSESLMKVIGGFVHKEESSMGQEVHMDVEPETLEDIQEYHDVRELEPEQLVSGSNGVRREAVVTRPDSGEAAGTDIDFSAILEAQADMFTGAGAMGDGMDEAAAAREQEESGEGSTEEAGYQGEDSSEEISADIFEKTIDMSAVMRSELGSEKEGTVEEGNLAVPADSTVDETVSARMEPTAGTEDVETVVSAVEPAVLESAAEEPTQGEPVSAVPENGEAAEVESPDDSETVETVMPVEAEPVEQMPMAEPLKAVAPAPSEPEEETAAVEAEPLKAVASAPSEPEEEAAVVEAEPLKAVAPALSGPEEEAAAVEAEPLKAVVSVSSEPKETAAVEEEPLKAVAPMSSEPLEPSVPEEPTDPIVSVKEAKSEEVRATNTVPGIVKRTVSPAPAEETPTALRGAQRPAEEAVSVKMKRAEPLPTESEKLGEAVTASEVKVKKWEWPKADFQDTDIKPAAKAADRKPETAQPGRQEPKADVANTAAGPDELDLEALLASEIEQMVEGVEKPEPKPEKDLITRLEEEADRTIVHEEMVKETPQDKRYRIIHADRPNRLTEEQKRLFTYFSKIPGMDEQILDAIHTTYNGAVNKTSRHGNIAIMGRPGTGKTRLSEGLVRSLCKEFEMPAAKIARVHAENLNEKDVAKVVGKMAGGFLIIEQAGKMSPETIHSLSQSMEFRTDSMILLIEDDKQDMRQLLADYPEFAEKFDSVISIPVFTNDELVTFARTYAGERGYKMDEMGVLALYTIIGDNQKEDEPVSVAQVKEMVDFAIRKASRGGRRFGRKLSGRQTDENNRIILYEKDFNIR